jgi:starch-binding outer membrane protein, SusD/RagB family
MQRLFFFCLLLLILPACEKLMHPEEISIGKIENYNMLVSAAEGVYGSLDDVMTDNSAYHANLKGDDINYYYPMYNSFYGQYYTPMNYNYDPYSEGYCWSQLYRTIASANNVLSQFESFRSQNEETRKVFGELYLIRAYCYFRLTRTYGQIPLINDIDINYNVTKASYPEIYNFIESDLRMAVGLLPVNNTSARIPFVTPHRGTAKAILAEVYLSRAGYPCNDFQKYAMAAKEAGETIDSAVYFGLGLLDDFASVWDSAHYYNMESVFSFYFPDPTSKSSFPSEDPWSWRNNNLLYSGRIDDYGDRGFMSGPESQILSLSFFCAEFNFFNNYPASYRKEITFFTNIYVPGDVKIKYPLLDTGYIHIKQVSGHDRIAYRKFYYRHYENAVYFDSNREQLDYIVYYGTSRIYLFRFAQTILTYAEAIARSGQLNPKAYECVNQIRRRAQGLDIYTPSIYDLQPGLSPEAFADSVVWERTLELCGEPEGRWFDLVRLEMVEDLPALRYKGEGGPPKVFDKSEYFFPIPERDVIINPNLGD